MTFIIGQRWISHPEPKLGLGIVNRAEIRRVTVEFPAADEVRTYSHDNSPLSRIIYREGDVIQTVDNMTLTVSAVNELKGILFYTGLDEDGREQTIAEQQLHANVQLTSPLQRLSSGSNDKNLAFELRLATLQHQQDLQQAPAAGLLGARTNLLPHQLYIAEQVAQRYAPRVLLADEVGLGKTIEAGLIIHQQLHTGRAQRVLVLLPPALQHQWLVEMLRRFNLRFSLFDEERYSALAEGNQLFDDDGYGDSDENNNGDETVYGEWGDEDDDDSLNDISAHEEPAHSDNPFETQQLILCSIDWLAQSPSALNDALAAPWDLLVVDEAHHLHWSPEAGGDNNYQCVEQLAQHSAGLILLTATPEQAGIESHFARLRLLDSARFHDLEAFKTEADNYQAINHVLQKIQDTKTIEEALSSTELKSLGQHFNDSEITKLRDRNELIQHLLDRHGTGRVLFRNTRAAVGGFPERKLNPVPLDLPALYGDIYKDLINPVYPELDFSGSQALEEKWLKEDPRVAWLEQFLKKNKTKKVLIICAHTDTALALEEYLHLRAGIRSAAFHEGLTLLERDRAAAWFAETELGAQALVCSEMGSEGRNFQFSQDLVLFDLPLNPDLLEQRIGRLDRIGQGSSFNLYVPYFKDSAQENLFQWYHEGLDLFQHTFSAGYSIYEQFTDRLEKQLSQTASESFGALLQDTQNQVAITRAELLTGRDALLELNSCNTEKAELLIDSIRQQEEQQEQDSKTGNADNNTDSGTNGDEGESSSLQNFMQTVWDYFGVDHEYHSEQALVIRPSEHMMIDHFPELNEDGCTLTFNRKLALQRDDMAFFTWEHPMVKEVMDMILGAEYGNSAISRINIKALPPASLLLEAVYNVQCTAPKSLQVERFLPSTPLRFLVDANGRNLSDALPHESLNTLCKDIPRGKIPAIMGQIQSAMAPLYKHSEGFAHKQLPSLIREAIEKLHESVNVEIKRLEALQKVNPAIRDEEIEFFRNQLEQGEATISQASIQPQALRLIINAT